MTTGLVTDIGGSHSQVLKFQLGCYHCVLQELEKARNYVQAAIAIDRTWADAAQSDEDLAPLRKKS